jgi:phosphatidyl-myo-inositol dimannoside synthase
VRIALVSHYFSSHRGGVELVAGRVAEGLVDEGHQVTWLASDSDPAPAGCRASCVPLRSWNFTERRLGIPWPIWPPAALRRVWREIKAADIVHLHEYEYPGTTIAYFMARALKRPVILTKHLALVPYDNRLLRGILHLVHRTLGRLVLKGSAQVIFISEHTMRYFRGYRYSRPPRLIPNGVDAGLYSPATSGRRLELRRGLGVDPSTPLCVFVGRFVEKKGLSIVEHLARQLPSIRWMLIGWGPIDPRRWQLSNVQVAGSLAPSEVVPYYQAADLLVLPSKGEGFPLVIQEAMACGTPAFVGADSAVASAAARPLLFSEEVSGNGARQRWLDKLEQIALNQPEKLEELRPKVAEGARAAWSWERCIAGNAEVVAEVAANRS